MRSVRFRRGTRKWKKWTKNFQPNDYWLETRKWREDDHKPIKSNWVDENTLCVKM